MPKKLNHNKLLEILTKFPLGANLNEIKKALIFPYSTRTLQRHLKSLIRLGLLWAEGKTKNRIYHLVTINTYREKPSKGDVLKLSDEALCIQSKIRQPIATRPRVGYNREFLTEYSPNETFYLSEALRSKLYDLGKTDGTHYPAGTYARQIFHRLLIDLSWNSSRLEGNTYSLLETERLFELGVLAEGKNAKDAQMILNHKAAIEFLVDSAKEIDINRYTILNLHALLSDNLLSDTACGSLRSISVGIGLSTYTPVAFPQLISEHFERLINTAKKIQNPFEQSFFLMVHLPYLQPFEDVNKRTSRLAANIPLIKKNLCPLSFIDVPDETYINGLLGVYELNQIELLRDVFVWAYERSCFLYSKARNTIGEPDPFRMKYRDSIIEVIAGIIRGNMNKTDAITAIQKRSEQIIPPEDKAQFIETVEREVQSLHEGSIARYRLRPSEYNKWKQQWK